MTGRFWSHWSMKLMTGASSSQQCGCRGEIRFGPAPICEESPGSDNCGSTPAGFSGNLNQALADTSSPASTGTDNSAGQASGLGQVTVSVTDTTSN